MNNAGMRLQSALPGSICAVPQRLAGIRVAFGVLWRDALGQNRRGIYPCSTRLRRPGPGISRYGIWRTYLYWKLKGMQGRGCGPASCMDG
ncbi:hypothetical protein V8C43DRAFT_277549 [Trichoderma afarasin]